MVTKIDQVGPSAIAGASLTGPNYPSSVLTGDFLCLWVNYEGAASNVDAVSGSNWTKVLTLAGGGIFKSLYVPSADPAGKTGSVGTITATGATYLMGTVVRFRATTGGNVVSIADSGYGVDSTSGTAYAAASVATFTTVSGGLMHYDVAFADTTTRGGRAISQTGATFGANTAYFGTGTGMTEEAGHYPVTTGAGPATITQSFTTLGTPTTGITAFVMLTEGPASTDATVTPGAIAAVTAAPQATPAAAATQSPGAVSSVATLPAASPSLSKSVTPAQTQTAVALPAAAASGGAVQSPAPASAITALPSASPSTGATVVPGVIGATVSAPASSRAVGAGPAAVATIVSSPQAIPIGGGSATVSPSAVTAVVAAPQATPAGSAVVSLAVTASIVTLPQAARQASTSVQPAAATSAVSLPRPAGSVTAGAAAVAAAAVLPPPAVLAGGNTTTSPASITVLVAAPQATRSAAVTALPARIQAVVTAPASAATVADTAAPAPISVITTFPQAAREGGAVATPAATYLLVQLYTATSGGPPPPYTAVLIPLATTEPDDGTAVTQLLGATATTRNLYGTAITLEGPMKTGDLEPPWTVALSDALAGGDLNDVVSWRFVGARQNGTVVFTDLAPDVDVDPTHSYKAVARHAWVDGETDAAGVLRAELVAVWPGGREQTFPGLGQATIKLEPGLD